MVQQRVQARAALSFFIVVGAALMFERTLGLGALFPLKAALIFAVAALLVVALARKHRVSRFGSANVLTLIRAALTALLLALLGNDANPDIAWFAAAVALLVVILDGVDGWLARRTGDSSAFGARFDMETDAALILATAALAWQFGKAGAWVLAAGLMRYVFVALGYLLPWLRRPLPFSNRRRTICVVQALSLVFCLAPLLLPPASDLVALAGLVALSGSFAADIVWLVRTAIPVSMEPAHGPRVMTSPFTKGGS